MKQSIQIFRMVPVIILSGLLLFSCKKERVNANGQQSTETRFPGNFTHVHTSGGSPVFISYGTQSKVELRGSANLIARFKTTINGQELALGYEHLNLGKDDLRVYVTLPDLCKVSLSGSAEMQIEGLFPYSPSFAADISGSGSITSAGILEAGETAVNISGSGGAWLQTLRSENARLNISGRGDIHIGQTEKLHATISGRGSVYYAGNPVLQTSISGTGKVVRETE